MADLFFKNCFNTQQLKVRFSPFHVTSGNGFGFNNFFNGLTDFVIELWQITRFSYPYSPLHFDPAMREKGYSHFTQIAPIFSQVKSKLSSKPHT